MRREALDTLSELAEALRIPESGEAAPEACSLDSASAAAAGELPPGTAALLAATPKLLSELEVSLLRQSILHLASILSDDIQLACQIETMGSELVSCTGYELEPIFVACCSNTYQPHDDQQMLC